MPPSPSPPPEPAARIPLDPEDDVELDEGLDLPLDDDAGSSGDEQEQEDELPEPPPGLEDEDGDARDDADAADLDTGVELDPLDDEEGAAEGAEIDVGPLDEGMTFDDEGAVDDRAESDEGEQDSIDIDENLSADDGGAEGTGEAPEDEVDESALPELDADDEGDEGDEELSLALLAGDEGSGVPWDAARWAPIEGAGAAVPCSALAITQGTVAAAGEVLLIVDEGARAARRAAFGAGASAVTIAEDLLMVATARGQLLLSRDGGKEASSLAGLQARHGPIELAATPGRVWIYCDEALLCFSAPQSPITTLREKGVIGMTSSGGVVIALTQDAEGPMIERLRGDDEGWQRTSLRGSARRIVERARAPIRIVAAAAGRCLAMTNGKRVAISRSSGESFEAIDLGAVIALAFAGDDEQAPLLALTAPAVTMGARAAPYPGPAEPALEEAEARLILVPAGAEPMAVAAVPGLGGGAAAMVWDASRDCVWIACGAGLLALGSAQRH